MKRETDYAKKAEEAQNLSMASEPHPIYYVRASQQGLPYNTIKGIQDKMKFSNREVSGILHISESTFQRLQKSQNKLDQDPSEKTIELSELIKKGEEVFGDTNTFRSWLYENNFALNNETPMSYLSSSIGLRYVMSLLVRIQWGIYS